MVGVDDNVIYFWFLNNLKRLSALGVFHVMRYIKCMIAYLWWWHQFLISQLIPIRICVNFTFCYHWLCKWEHIELSQRISGMWMPEIIEIGHSLWPRYLLLASAVWHKTEWRPSSCRSHGGCRTGTWILLVSTRKGIKVSGPYNFAPKPVVRKIKGQPIERFTCKMAIKTVHRCVRDAGDVFTVLWIVDVSQVESAHTFVYIEATLLVGCGI